MATCKTFKSPFLYGVQSMAKTVWSISFDIVTKQTRKEMYADAKKAIDAANKRIKRLEASGLFSPALESVKKHGGKFSTKGLNRNQLLREYAKAVEFMNMKTSTITGAKVYEKQIAMKLSNKAKTLTIDQKKTLFKAVRRTMEANPTLSDLYGSDRLIRFVADEVSDNNEDLDSLLKNSFAELDRNYKKFVKGFGINLDDTETPHL